MTDQRWSAARIAQVTGAPAPTAEQTAVIEAPLEPMLVVAGAGSGKTATMAARVVYLLVNQLVQPGEVLGLTFTRKAASELSERIRKRMRDVRVAGARIATDDRPRVATYNSYAGAIVRDHALRLGHSPDAVHVGQAGRFQLAEALVAGWMGELDTESKPSTLVDGITALDAELNEHGVAIDDARAAFEAVVEQLQAHEPAKSSDAGKAIEKVATRAQLMDLVAEFVRRKRAAGVLDFGEEVRLAAQLAQHPEVATSERGRYRVVLLDEYQDTSIAQVELLAALFDGGHPVTAVGDPHQAIYGWRGAAAGTLFDFPATFAQRDGTDAEIKTLATAWRNDAAILAAANCTAAPLRSLARGDVPALVTRPGVSPGAVTASFTETIADEADLVADYLAGERGQGDQPSQTSAAVLCRRRSQFPVIAAALTERDIPVQVVGLAGLLLTPEVADIWSALTVVHDPGRGDALMRLLTGAVNLGASDLLALGHWSRAQARRSAPHRDRPEDESASGRSAIKEPAELACLAEAIDQPPPINWRDPEGRELSQVARTRLSWLADALQSLRGLNYLALPDLVASAEQVIGVDIEVAAARPGPVGEARRNLDEFTEVAARFSSDSQEPTLGAFLAWLDAALEEERGLDTTEPEPDPAAVQVMTVHAAKGLEWDVVVVPGMVETTFPAIRAARDGQRRDSGWLTGVATLPYDLRGDREHLPQLDLSAATDKKDLNARIGDFKVAEGARKLNEERRLAYVAFTRARHRLLLTGSFWRDGKTVAEPSIFLTELLAAGIAEAPQWPAASAFDANPTVDQVYSATWPRPPSDAARAYQHLQQQAQPEQAGTQEPDRLDQQVQGWWRDARMLLAERDTAQHTTSTPPEHLSASAIVAMGTDPVTFQRDRRRPIPRRPSAAARRGTVFHAWVEQHYGAQALLDSDELPGAQDSDVGDPDSAQLIEAFLVSQWANRTPVRIEAEVETPVAGMSVRCRIDAVFPDGDDGYHVVDWKTGPPPTDPEQLRVRHLQLSVYRLAWARLMDLDPARVRASFHHVAQNITIESPPMSSQDLEHLVAGLVAASD
ncbi:MAG: UvrD-helicase domain-containing protein [Beutenbergiaceae bacterium]